MSGFSDSLPLIALHDDKAEMKRRAEESEFDFVLDLKESLESLGRRHRLQVLDAKIEWERNPASGLTRVTVGFDVLPEGL